MYSTTTMKMYTTTIKNVIALVQISSHYASLKGHIDLLTTSIATRGTVYITKRNK